MAPLDRSYTASSVPQVRQAWEVTERGRRCECGLVLSDEELEELSRERKRGSLGIIRVLISRYLAGFLVDVLGVKALRYVRPGTGPERGRVSERCLLILRAVLGRKLRALSFEPEKVAARPRQRPKYRRYAEALRRGGGSPRRAPREIEPDIDSIPGLTRRYCKLGGFFATPEGR